jgi:hypothetical protein
MSTPPDDPEPHRDYGYMERQALFKLLAAHGMVDDEDFFERLREDPRKAAASIRIALDDADVEYINGLDWETLAANRDAIRASLNLEQVTNSW